jgi:hypothetical protein
MDPIPLPTRQKHDEGLYAVRVSDSTWVHSAPPPDEHYPSREEILDVARKFDNQARTIISANPIEHAAELQSLTDLLMDETMNLLRAEDRSLCGLVERARTYYARIFEAITADAERARAENQSKIQRITGLELALEKAEEDVKSKVREIQGDFQRQMDDQARDMESKKEEYDASMKRFLEQKTQLEDHVKALHRVFMDFQSDAVYLTLEELKEKQKALEKKISARDSEISKLNTTISKMQKQINEAEAQTAAVEAANDELRRNLAMAMAANNRLQRRLEMHNMDAASTPEAEEVAEEPEAAAPKANDVNLGDAPLINAEVVQSLAQAPKISRRERVAASGVDSQPYFTVIQKLGQVTDRISAVLQAAAANVLLPESSTDETDRIMLSANPQLMIRAIQMKANEVLQYTDCLENLDLTAGGSRSVEAGAPEPRFLQFIKGHNQRPIKKGDGRLSPAVLLQVRQIFDAKYLSDRLNSRMGRPFCRFPEFVLDFFARDGETLFAALITSTRLWRSLSGVKAPELKLFKHFLVEKLTLDELSFFVEARNSLIGRRSSEDDPLVISIPYAKCQEFATAVLGAFSPVLATVSQEAQKQAQNGFIDYAVFLNVLMTYYQNERKRRRNAVRLMFQSKNFGKADAFDFELFVSTIRSLGFQGSDSDIFALFREANLFGAGTATIDSLLMAMDSLGFHFYSIEMPLSQASGREVTKMQKNQITLHWRRFASWFSAFHKPIPDFDPWLRSTLINLVRRVDTAFSGTASASVLFSEYRQLLDFFQFALDVLARTAKDPMPQLKSERQLLLLENIIDLLLTFVVSEEGGEILFNEAM